MSDGVRAVRPGNGFAVAGLVVAVVATLLNVGSTAVAVLAPVLARNGMAASGIPVVFAVVGVVLVLLYAVAAVLGLVGVLRPDRPRVVAGVALGVGTSGVVLATSGLVLPPLVGLALRL